MKASVIVPVYNVAPYLRRCLDSLVGQTLRDIEIICVDDGSTDSSPAILADYAAKDPRVKVITQPKSNAGAARNAGMAVATGEWLFFCDADDTMTGGLLERLVSVAEAKAADLVISGFKQREDGLVSDHPPPDRLIQKAAPDTTGVCPPSLFVDARVSPWNKLFRRDLIADNRLRFQEVQRHNDLLFVCLALALADHPVAISTCGYLYHRGRPGSISRQLTRCDAFVDALLGLRRELQVRKLWHRAGAAFVNVALAHCCYHLLGGGDAESFTALYLALHRHALADLGLDPIPANILIDHCQVEYLKAILSSPDPTGLWMILLAERHQAWKVITQRSIRIGVLEKRLVGCRTEAQRTEVRLKQSEGRVQLVEAEIEEGVRKCMRLQAELADAKQSVVSLTERIGALESSWAYRLGAGLLYPMRLVKRLWR